MKKISANIHVCFVLANNSSAPYFNWFAEKAFREKNITLSFVCLHHEEPAMIHEVGKYGWKCYWLPFNHLHRKSGMIKALLGLIKLFRKIKPDVVHTHLFDDSLPALLAARIAGVRKRIITKGDTAYHFNYASKWVLFDRFNNYNATHIIAPSGESRDFIVRVEKPAAKKLYMIHHGIPVPEEKPDQALINALKDKFALNGKKIIGTIARFIEWKGYKTILNVAVEVIEKHPDAVFLFIGTGPQEAELKALVRERSLENNFIFTSWLTAEEILAIYRILDVYLHAAYFEPFGFVIAEALMAGVPVVSTPTGAAADAVVNGENGFLGTYGNAHSLAKGVISLLDDNNLDFRIKARESALNLFTFERMWAEYLNLYT